MATSATTPAAPGLFDRLGGFDAVERISARLIPRLMADPSLNGLVRADTSELRWQVQLLLTERLGGPMAYDGPELATIRDRHHIDAGRWRQILGHTLACLAVEAGDDESLTAAERVLEQLGASLGLGPGSTPPGPQRFDLVARAEAVVAEAGQAEWNLFVVNPELVLLHQNAGALEATRAVDADLRRAFRRGAADLVGQSLLRIHSAPTNLQAVLSDVQGLPREVVWSFGQVVWKACLHPVRTDDGAVAGFAMAWRDESEPSRAKAVFERLRTESEDLPVPIMLPDVTLERWFGNAACEHALTRLAPHLARPVNPLDGVPIQIFLPDEAERTALFRDPAKLPFKRQIRIGSETVSFLVAAVLDEQQRYLGPQITWEIVHFTKPAEPEPEPAAPVSEPPAASLAPAPGARPEPAAAAAGAVSSMSPADALRQEVRSLEAASQELQLLTRLLLSVADEAEGQVHVAPVSPDQLADAAVKNRDETATVASAALAVLEAARQVPAGHQRREQTEKALATLNGIARRANRIALDGALLAVQDEAAVQTTQLVDESRAFARGMVERLRVLTSHAQLSADVLRQSAGAAVRLSGLRSQLGEGAEERDT